MYIGAKVNPEFFLRAKEELARERYLLQGRVSYGKKDSTNAPNRQGRKDNSVHPKKSRISQAAGY